MTRKESHRDFSSRRLSFVIRRQGEEIFLQSLQVPGPGVLQSVGVDGVCSSAWLMSYRGFDPRTGNESNPRSQYIYIYHGKAEGFRTLLN